EPQRRAGRLLAPAVGSRLAATAAPDVADGAQPPDVVRRGAARGGRRRAAALRRAARRPAARVVRRPWRRAPGRLRRPGRRALPRRGRRAARLPPGADRLALHAARAPLRPAARPRDARLRRHGRPRQLRARGADAAPHAGRDPAAGRHRLHGRQVDPRRRPRPLALPHPPLPLRRRPGALRARPRDARAARAPRGRLRRRHRRAHRPRARRRDGRAPARLGHPDGRPDLQDRSRHRPPGAQPLLSRQADLRQAAGGDGRLRRRADAVRAQRRHAVDQPDEEPRVPRGRPPGGLHADPGRRLDLLVDRGPAQRRPGLRRGLPGGPAAPAHRPRPQGRADPPRQPLGHHRAADGGLDGPPGGGPPRRARPAGDDAYGPCVPRAHARLRV
ncbi:MAG: Glycosyltransferase, partial [uncultured Solirubrobacteraceae bacterium]